MKPRSFQRQVRAIRRPATGRERNHLATRQVGAGERIRSKQSLVAPFVHQLSAVLAAGRAQLDDVVGPLDRGGIVLDHQHRVPQIAQLLEQLIELLRVARVETDRWLIQDVGHVDQRAAQRVGQVDALGLTAGQGSRLSIERQVAQPHLVQEADSGPELPEDRLGNGGVLLGQLHALDPAA